MKIYIDFDDCLCETARHFSGLVYEMFGKEVYDMEVTLKDISNRILEIAEESGYSKYGLADKVTEVVQSTVYNAISGERSMKVYPSVSRWQWQSGQTCGFEGVSAA